MPHDTDPAWWTDAVVYQVYPRSFADADSDGMGDLAGIRSHLDHLEDLGIDVIWLSPVYASPQDDNGYDISDYRSIEPAFGTIDDFDDLLAEVHDRGLKLVMDLVVNHTSDEHEWFVESRSGPDSPKRDWYWWRGPRQDMAPGDPGAEPTNWGSFFSGSAWELDDDSGEYYLHLFSRKQPDLNWENPDVRAAVYDMMNWWLDRGVDGFRMDVINFISKDPDLPDGEVPPDAHHGNGFPFFASGPRIHEFLQEMHREVFAGRDADLLTVGEMVGVTVDQAQRYTDQARDELDMVFTFEHVQVDQGSDKWDKRPLDLPALKAIMNRWQVGLSDVGWNSLYWCNHDQPRAVSRFGDDGQHRARSAKLLGTLLHLHRGTPYVYQGEELGMANFPFTAIEQYRDIESVNHYTELVDDGAEPDEVLVGMNPASRDNARTPMQWDAGAHAGFTTGEPWIAVNPDHEEWNAAAQIDDPDSVFHHYRRLIDLRHVHPVVAHGEFRMLLGDDERVYAFTRTLDDVELLVLANVSGDDDVAVDLSELDDPHAFDDADLLLGNVDDDGVYVPMPTLRPWEARVLRRDVAR